MANANTERKSHFRFKQFTIAHDRSTMKVGTDAVLLAAWARMHDATALLDIGTGCGVIALMLAQRTIAAAHIHAVEMDVESAAQAAENFAASPWPEKLQVHQTKIQDFDPIMRFDLIISNPPFFNRSLTPPNARRGHARHTSSLGFLDLLHAVDGLLDHHGRFNVILPFNEGNDFIRQAEVFGFRCSRKWKCKSKNSKPWERWLLEWTRMDLPAETGEIVINGSNDHWSDDYIRLTQDFYTVL